MSGTSASQKMLAELSVLKDRVDGLTAKVESLERRQAEIATQLEHLATTVEFMRAELARISHQLWGNGNPEQGLIYFSAAQRVKAHILWSALSAAAGLAGGVIALVGEVIIRHLL